MKNKELTIRNRFDKSIKILFHPLYKYPKDFDKSDYIFAFVVSNLESFNNFVYKTREKLNISKVSAQESNKAIEMLDKNALIFLDVEANKLLKKYNLTNNWKLWIQATVFTNTLFVPPADIGISILFPQADYYKERKAKKLRSYFVVSQLQEKLISLTSYPTIRFTKKITVTDFIEWIKLHSSKITKIIYQSNLPEKTKPKIADRTLLWGHIAWLLKEEGVNSWKNMEDYLEQIDKKENFIPDDELFMLPTSEDLRLAYNSYQNTIRKIESA